MRLENKAVTSIANPDVGVRCHVSLLDLMPPFPSYPSYSIKNDYTPQPQ